MNIRIKRIKWRTSFSILAVLCLLGNIPTMAYAADNQEILETAVSVSCEEVPSEPVAATVETPVETVPEMQMENTEETGIVPETESTEEAALAAEITEAMPEAPAPGEAEPEQTAAPVVEETPTEPVIVEPEVTESAADTAPAEEVTEPEAEEPEAAPVMLMRAPMMMSVPETTSIQIQVTDQNGNAVSVAENMYVFLIGPNNDRITGTIDENGQLVIEGIYDQNGNNLHSLSAGSYQMILAGDKRDVTVTDKTRYDQNDFNTMRDGQKLDGTSTLHYSGNITVNEGGNTVNIQVAEKNGTAYSAEDIKQQLGDTSDFGIFTRELQLAADSEATIAVETVKHIGSNYGLSDNNYNAMNNTIHVTGNYTENGEAVADKELTITLFRNGREIESTTGTTDENGNLEYSFEGLRDGEYSISITQDDKTVISEKAVEIQANKSYVGSAENAKDLNKMRGTGYLVVGDENLYNQLVNDQEILAHNIVVEKGEMSISDDMNRVEKLSADLSGAKSSSNVKVYDFTASEFSQKNYKFYSGNRDYVLVNIDLTGVNEYTLNGEHTLNGQKLEADFADNIGKKIIYNFITKDGDTVKPYDGIIRTSSMTSGIILAPGAVVYGATGNHGGTIIAGVYIHNTGEVHEKKTPRYEFMELRLDRTKTPEEPETPPIEEPDEPGVPDEPTPDEPVVPDEPTPDEPEVPDEPTPDEPVVPDEPTPDEPEVPDEPTPDEPVVPDEPTPDEPEIPDEPTPDEPVVPDEPTPDEPEVPDEPTPDEPVVPDEPTPEEPEVPDEPTPDEPVVPDEPTPDEPEVPEEPTPDEPVVPDEPTPDEPEVPEEPTPEEPEVPENPTPDVPVTPSNPTPTPVPETPTVETPAAEIVPETEIQPAVLGIGRVKEAEPKVKGVGRAQTGDASNLPLWIGIMIAALAGMIGFVIYRKKRS